jgi:hypothetical protein
MGGDAVIVGTADELTKLRDAINDAILGDGVGYAESRVNVIGPGVRVAKVPEAKESDSEG